MMLLADVMGGQGIGNWKALLKAQTTDMIPKPVSGTPDNMLNARGCLHGLLGVFLLQFLVVPIQLLLHCQHFMVFTLGLQSHHTFAFSCKSYCCTQIFKSQCCSCCSKLQPRCGQLLERMTVEKTIIR